VFLATGAALERHGPKLIDYPPGLVERTELIIFFVVLALLLQFGPWLCYAYTPLELITAAQRLLFVRRMLSGKPRCLPGGTNERLSQHWHWLDCPSVQRGGNSGSPVTPRASERRWIRR
jgi:hypothetical protein